MTTLAQMGRTHNAKAKKNYAGAMPKTMEESAYLYGALAKIIRVIVADSTAIKVADDMMDVVKYSELFWKSFEKRTGVKVKIDVELFR